MSVFPGRFEGRCAIVTGGASGLGKQVAARIVAEGGKVALWDLNADALDATKDEIGATHVQALDVSDEAAVAAAAKDSAAALGKIDILVCSAGITGATATVWDYPLDSWQRVIDINLNGLFYCNRAVVPFMLENGYGRIVNLASVAGKEGNPNASAYSASKAASDHLVRAYHHTFGLETTTSNCSNNYGPYQFPEKLIPLFLLNALHGRDLPIYGDGMNVRDWLHVEDHCRGIELVLENGKPGEVYNIGGNCERTNLEVVEAICRAVEQLRPDLSHAPLKDLVTFVDDRPGHDLRYAIDASKIRDQLGWSPSEDFETGLQKTVLWYLENESWVNNVQSGSYRGQRLGLGTTATDPQAD